MKPLLLVRLWLMVFLHYFVWGSWYVTMGTYATTKLGFAGGQVGLAYGTMALGALLSPFIVGIIADRFFATQRILALLHLVGAGLLYWVSTLQEFGVFYLVLLVYTITYMAGHALTNTLTLHHSKNPAKEFPLVMIMASVGWIVARRATAASNVVHSPARTIERTVNRADNLDPTAEVMNIAMETGSILMPVSRASRPRTICR